jgi:phosphoketolase
METLWIILVLLLATRLCGLVASQFKQPARFGRFCQKEKMQAFSTYKMIRSVIHLSHNPVKTWHHVEWNLTSQKQLKRVVNVVDLMALQPQSEHPHGLPDSDFNSLFPKDMPVIFAYHGYPWLIHRLTYRRLCHPNLYVRGYKEEGTTTTPFDMVVLNDMDRFHLMEVVIDRVPVLGDNAAYIKQSMRDKLIDHKQYICKPDQDMPEIREWQWPY